MTMLNIENNSDVPNKDDSWDGIAEVKSEDNVEHFENNSDVPVKGDSLDGVSEVDIVEHHEKNSDVPIKDDFLKCYY